MSRNQILTAVALALFLAWRTDPPDGYQQRLRVLPYYPEYLCPSMGKRCPSHLPREWFWPKPWGHEIRV